MENDAAREPAIPDSEHTDASNMKTQDTTAFLHSVNLRSPPWPRDKLQSNIYVLDMLYTIKTAMTSCPRMKTAILAESGEHEGPHPCEGCIPGMKIAILAESGEHEGHDPCEGCTPKRKPAILAESGEHAEEKRRF